MFFQGKTKRFSFSKSEVIERYTVSGARPIKEDTEGTAADETPKDALPSTSKKKLKKVAFELVQGNNTSVPAADVINRSTNPWSVTFPAAEVSPHIQSFPPSPTEDVVITTPEQTFEDEDPTDLSRFGIYFNDDYDYSQHLKDRNSFTLGGDNIEMYTVQPVS